MNENEQNRPENQERRSFLKSVALGGAAIGLAGSLQAQEAHQDHQMHQGHSSSNAHQLHQGHTMNPQDPQGSMMFMEGHRMEPGQVVDLPGAPMDHEVDYKEFEMEVSIIQHEILPGVKVHFFAFNKQIPGPTFRVTEGDWVKVRFTNNTEEMHTIHWHGLTVPYTMDGVPMVTQDPVHPGQTFVYRFQAKPSGTRWYHCHWSTVLHGAMAMHGPFIIEKKKDPLKERYPYTREYTLMLQSFDVDFARTEMNGLLRGMKEVNTLMKQGKLHPMTHGFFRNYEEFVKAVESGEYIPPYLTGRTSGSPIQPNFFGINGKSYPATERLYIKRGEWIRVRLISASNQSHHMHLHGHDFWWVAQDGNDLEVPRRLNTIHVEPGGTYDIMIHGDNPGFWTFHDHNTANVRNNGVYPGGMLTALIYEDLKNPPYQPSLSLIQ